MAKAGYSAVTGAAVALSAGTAKTILYALAPAQFGMDLVEYTVSSDGVTASAVPLLVEICTSTAATNSTPGTVSTSLTVVQEYGRSVTAGFTGAYNCTSEPTVLVAIRSHLIPAFMGTYTFRWPLGTSPDNDVSKGFAIRCTAPATVNVRGELHFERC